MAEYFPCGIGGWREIAKTFKAGKEYATLFLPFSQIRKSVGPSQLTAWFFCCFLLLSFALRNEATESLPFSNHMFTGAGQLDSFESGKDG